MSKVKKYRIGIVANTTWNIYNFRLNILRKLLQSGYDVCIFAPVDEYIIYKKEFPSIQHVPIKSLYRDSVNPFKDFLLLSELIRKYKRNPVDLMLHYTIKPNIYGALAAKVNNIPSIGIVTGLGYPLLRNSWLNWTVKSLYKFSAKFHKKIIFENIDDRKLFTELGMITKSKGISVKGCGVNTTHFSPLPQREEIGKTIFTFIGRLLYDKGIKEFVSAAKLLKELIPSTECWIVGEIDHYNPASVKEEDLVKWVKEKSIIYQGSTKDVRDFIRLSDCIVLPSYREAIARSLTESMSMEKPVIATNVAGCKEAVDHGENGFLIPRKDTEALLQAMISFTKLDREKRLKMGRAGRIKAVKEFDDALIAQQILDIIENEIHG